jgi:hypothetical protein
MGQVFSNFGYSNPSDDFYPVCDDDGYYLAYQKYGVWKNWWSRKSPSYLRSIYNLLFKSTSDQSDIPDAEVLDQTLPVRIPYWVKSGTI